MSQYVFHTNYRRGAEDRDNQGGEENRNIQGGEENRNNQGGEENRNNHRFHHGTDELLVIASQTQGQAWGNQMQKGMFYNSRAVHTLHARNLNWHVQCLLAVPR